MTERLPIPGPRDVHGTREGPDNAQAVVVACPPHPRMGGSRNDSRLTTVADALADRSIATIRFDYGPWDEGHGEVSDVIAAVRWARQQYERVGLFGYSFGGGIALLAGVESGPDAVSVLAPMATAGDRDTVAAVRDLETPLQVFYGERDETTDWKKVVEEARESGATIERIDGNHFFVGQRRRVANLAATWLADRLDPT